MLFVLSLAGCAASGNGTTHLDARECSDLAANRANAPASHEREMSELSALEKAGYRPWLRWDPYYPDDLQAAQRRVEAWYQTECPQARAQ